MLKTLNVFGEKSPSAAAIRYATGNEYALQKYVEDYAGLSLAGDLFTLPGGPLSFALGGECRRDSARQTADAVNDRPEALGVGGPGSALASGFASPDRGP